MKLVALTFARIDGDVIEEFLRHTARFVDHHYLVIMGTSDDTLTIVEALVAEGLPITIWRLSNAASLEGDARMTAPFARLAFEQQRCDFLLPIDADEFLIADDREHLERALQALPAGAHALANWSTYLPSQRDDPLEPRVLVRISHRRKTEAPAYAKVFINRSYLDEPRAVITAGNHLVSGGNSQCVTLADVRLAHFPVRNLLQIQSKALLGSSAILMAGSEKIALGYQWQLAYKRLFESGEDAAPRDLCRLAANYLNEAESEWNRPDFLVYDRLPSVPRTYVPKQPGLLALSLGLSFRASQAYGALRNTIMPPPLDPATQWPDYDAASGTVDLARIVDVRGRLHLELEGWISIPDPLVSIDAVYAIFPGKKIALLSVVERPQRSQFRGTIDIDDVEDGTYILRVFAFGGAKWFVLRQIALINKRDQPTIL